MSGKEVIPISSVKKPERTVALTDSGLPVSLENSEWLMAQHYGFESSLAVWADPPRFEVTMSYMQAEWPKDKIGFFLVVNDGGYPFLLGCTRTSWGVRVRYNSYINPLLERDLTNIKVVEVIEIFGAEKRMYQVPLRHCFE